MQQRTKLILAVLLALVGIVLGARAIFKPSLRGPRVVATQGPAMEPLPIAATLDAEFADAPPVRAEDAEDLASLIADAARSGLLALPAHERPRSGDIDALVDEIGEIFAIYLTGDWERYARYVETRDAVIPGWESSEERRKYASVFESMVSTVKLRPVSLDEIVVRARYLRGDEITPDENLGNPGTVTAAGRYGLPEDPKRGGLTVYETAVPVSYTWDGETSPMFIAIWHAWSTERGRWLPWRLVVYDPTYRATVVPPPHP